MTANDAADIIAAFDRIDHSESVLADARIAARKQLCRISVSEREMTTATRERLRRLGYLFVRRGTTCLSRWWLNLEKPYYEVTW